MDKEKTNIYSKLQSLSEEENILRTLLLSCNEWVFNEQNKAEECNFGYELVCGNFKNGKLIFLQAGHPFIYLDRPEIPLQSLGHVLDFSGLFLQKRAETPPSSFNSYRGSSGIPISLFLVFLYIQGTVWFLSAGILFLVLFWKYQDPRETWIIFCLF